MRYTNLDVEEIIGTAIESLKPIKYESFGIGYYVCKNDSDMGDSDFCINCIDEEVLKCKKYHKDKRIEILEKFKQIKEKGYFKQGKKKIIVEGNYTKKQISEAKRYELKEYPSKATFTYEGHDPDFGGGLHEPCSCDNCGEYFTCSFTPDKDEAEHLLHIVNINEPLTDMSKWELDIALSNFRYVENAEVENILIEVAIIINNKLDK